MRTQFISSILAPLLQQRPVDRLLVGERDARRRQGEQGGPAARDQAEHEIVLGQAPAPARRIARGRFSPAASGTGMARLHDLDALSRPTPWP